METVVSKVYAALPGTAKQIAHKTGIELRKVQKSLSNQRYRGLVRGKGKGVQGDEIIWSATKAKKPTYRTHRNIKKKAKKKKAKRRYTKRNKHPALILYLETLEARIKKLEEVIGV